MYGYGQSWLEANDTQNWRVYVVFGNCPITRRYTNHIQMGRKWVPDALTRPYLPYLSMIKDYGDLKKTFISLQKETTSFSGPCVQFFRCCYRFKPVISLLVPYPWHKNCIPWLLSSRRGLLSGSGGLSGATPSTGWLQKTSSWLLGMYTIVYPHKMSL
jgi:hypothetical protein